MDDNKQSSMNDVGWRFIRACSNCRHSKPASRTSVEGWAHCTRFAYNHKRHDGPKYLPAHMFAVCDSHGFNEDVIGRLGDYRVFVDRSGEGEQRKRFATTGEVIDIDVEGVTQ